MDKSSHTPLDAIQSGVRRVIRQIARFLNWISGGRLSPTMVTIVGLLAHLPIAYLIATRHNYLGAILLIIFGLFDTLDGELARLQKSESTKGMLLDSVTDRFKEVIIYTAVGYNLISIGQKYMAVWAILACGASLCVSYVRAKGESAYISEGNSPKLVNKLFKDGIMRFEIRMLVIVIGLLTNYLGAAVVIIAIMASYTALSRLINVNHKLDV